MSVHDDAVARALAALPPPTPEQLETVAAILRLGRADQVRAAARNREDSE